MVQGPLERWCDSGGCTVGSFCKYFEILNQCVFQIMDVFFRSSSFSSSSSIPPRPLKVAGPEAVAVVSEGAAVTHGVGSSPVVFEGAAVTPGVGSVIVHATQKSFENVKLEIIFKKYRRWV